jgi:radical SAM protein with 4Fe4S-binding SPASM domain
MGNLLDEVNRKYEQSCRLQTVTLEITRRCICSCVHCYLVERPMDELTTSEIERLFGELHEEGVIYLAITGGEPFLRDDLPRVLELAHKERFLTAVLTTGILIGESEARHMKRTGVTGVEMSLLGATADTHDALIGYPGAFGKMQEAVRRLQAVGIEVALKATVLSRNYRELSGMHDAARALGVPLAASRAVTPAIDGNRSPQKWMVNAAQAAELDALMPPEVHPGNQHGLGGAVHTCKAGKTYCGITPPGEFLPCILFRRTLGSIRNRSLYEIWHGDPDPFLKRLRRLEPEDVRECLTCSSRQSCLRCPGIAFTETGELGGVSPSLCRLAANQMKNPARDVRGL